jgi:hypothetical protein
VKPAEPPKEISPAEAKQNKLEAEAEYFKEESKKAIASRVEAQANTREARDNAKQAKELADVAAKKAKEAKSRAEKAKGTEQEEALAKLAEQAKQEADTARQNAENARTAVRQANDKEAVMKQAESEARQLEAEAKKQASIPKREAIVAKQQEIQARLNELQAKINEKQQNQIKLRRKLKEILDRKPGLKGQERAEAQAEVDRLNAKLDSIAEHVSPLLDERAKLSTQVENLKAKLNEEVRRSTELPEDVKKKLRRASPNDELRDYVNDPSNPQTKIDPNTKKPIDPVYNRPVKKLSPDHIVPLEEIMKMPGFSELSYEQQLEVANLKKNIIGMEPAVNKSKQNKSWAEFEGHSEYGPIDPAVRKQMMQLEIEARAALEKAIEERLHK